MSREKSAAPASVIESSAAYYGDKFENKEWYLDGSNLSNLSIDVYSVWKDYTGTGVKVGVIDSQIDFRHSDLQSAYDSKLDYNFALGTGDVAIDPANLPYYHGTAVAGVISAQAGNGLGTVGIASGATLVGYGVDYSSDSVADQITAALHAAKGVDVVNNSWSFVESFADDFSRRPQYNDALVDAVTNGRGGLGTSIVFAAGNAGSTSSSNYHNFQNSPYAIAVGAVEPDGRSASFSSIGANVLISAAGRDVFTTTLNERYDAATGTSFAAPAVSAVVALMLQANPNLGYRDVQEILAYSAQRTGLSDDARFGEGWMTNGATNYNGGGLHYSDSFGYGYLNAHDAVRLAESWTQQQTIANLATATKAVATNQTLVAGSKDHLSVSIAMDKAIDIEHVQLSMDLRWAEAGNLDVYLVSPDGTQVRLMYDLPSADRAGNPRNFTFSSVASMGEQSAGTWTLEIYNRNPAAINKDGTPMTGALQGVTLTVSGNEPAKDDTYIYTDEFGTLYDGQDMAARSKLADHDGGTDTLNAAAVTSGSYIDLTGGTASRIAGKALTLDKSIENAFGGDGNDTLIGSDVGNRLDGGRGDDTIYFSFGNDTINGGAGQDTLVVNSAFGSISGYVTQSGAVAISVRAGEVSAVTGVESFHFADVTYSYADLLKLLDKAAAEGGDSTPPPVNDPPVDQSPAGNSGGDTPSGNTPPAQPEQPEQPAKDYVHFFTGTQGADKLIGSDSADLITGNGGDDTLSGMKGNDTIDGGAGNDKIRGGDGLDTLEGGAGNDKIWGDNGADILHGGAGNDTLYGGAGNDWLEGGQGADRMYGGAGADKFVFDISTLDALDYIYDFNAAEGDEIIVTGLGAAGAANFTLETRGQSTYLTMHMGNADYDIARIKGSGLDHLDLTASDYGLIIT